MCCFTLSRTCVANVRMETFLTLCFIRFLSSPFPLRRGVAAFMCVHVHTCVCVLLAVLSFLILFFQSSFFPQTWNISVYHAAQAAHGETLVAFSKSKTEEYHEDRTKEIKTLDMPQLSYAAVRNLIILSHRIMCPSEIILD